MQILLGVHETIVRINSHSLKIDYIQHYIHRYFNDVVLSEKSLYIPASHKNSHYRIFLLKWLYALYAKKSKNNIFELKETLLRREQKAIKITFAHTTVYKILWNISDSENLTLKVEPYNPDILCKIEKYFKTSLHVTQNQYILYLNSPQQKERLKRLLSSSDNIGQKCQHIFDQQQMDAFVDTSFKKEKPKISSLQKAHIILGALPGDDVQTLKQRYKKLAKKYHPDRVNPKDDKSVALYTEKFQNILQAYEILLKQAG